MSQLEDRRELLARSWLIAEGVDLTRGDWKTLARSPLTIQLGEGIAVLFRYGAVVLFGVTEEDARALFEQLKRGAPERGSEGDTADLRLAEPDETEGVDSLGRLVVQGFDLARLRVVAEALARSAVLTFYEGHLAVVLSELEPPIARLRERGRLPMRTRDLLCSVGEALATEMRMVGRAEISEKPELVWDQPPLDHLYSKLAEEFELIDRDRALSRKLDLVTRTVSVLMDALSARRSLNVEWAIFALIMVELFIML